MFLGIRFTIWNIIEKIFRMNFLSSIFIEIATMCQGWSSFSTEMPIHLFLLVPYLGYKLFLQAL